MDLTVNGSAMPVETYNRSASRLYLYFLTLTVIGEPRIPERCAATAKR